MRRHEGGAGCGPRGRGSQPRTRATPGPRPGGITTALRGARWTGTGCRSPRPRKRGPELRWSFHSAGRAAVERREAWRPIARTPPCFAGTELLVRLSALRSPHVRGESEKGPTQGPDHRRARAAPNNGAGGACAIQPPVMAGHSRSKNGVASLAYVPAIHALPFLKRRQTRRGCPAQGRA
jgi:hypothetical protein